MRRTVVSIVTGLAGIVAAAGSAHERQEIAGMRVVFGGEPEPVVDGELCYLRWRFTDLETGEPVSDLENVEARVEFDGKAYGPFEARASRRDPGMYQTYHIFTRPAEGRATLRFKRAGEEHTITLPFRVRPRRSIEIP